MSCKHELDSLARRERITPATPSGGTEKPRNGHLRTLLTQLHTRLAIWMGPRSKRPGSSGFDSRRTLQAEPPRTRHHYVIAREDLPLGTLAAQIVHAAGESSPGDLPEGTIAVALAARSESHLEFLEDKLRRFSIPHKAIREPDSPWNNALMAIGIHPVEDREVVRPVTSGLKLLK